MKDPLKHKETIRKMLEEERRVEKDRRLKKKANAKESKDGHETGKRATAVGEDFDGRRTKNAQGDDLPWWINQ
jgi:hypothetical protein